MNKTTMTDGQINAFMELGYIDGTAGRALQLINMRSMYGTIHREMYEWYMIGYRAAEAGIAATEADWDLDILSF